MYEIYPNIQFVNEKKQNQEKYKQGNYITKSVKFRKRKQMELFLSNRICRAFHTTIHEQGIRQLRDKKEKEIRQKNHK